MMKRTLTVFALSLFFLTTTLFAQGVPQAKNVIILIGDGMGFNSDLAGTYYRYGEAGKQSYHSFPVRLGCTTYAQAKADTPVPADFDKGYDPEVFWKSLSNGSRGTELTVTADSAATSTSIHSGVKTRNGKIGVNAQNEPVELISEIAARTGRKTGCISTVPIAHATPAGFAAHARLRGDLDEIFKEMTDEHSPLTVMMGCGHPLYAQGRKRSERADETDDARKKRFLGVGGEETWEKLKDGVINGFVVIETKEQFEELASPKPGAKLPAKVVGLVRSQDQAPPVDGTLDDVEATKKLLETEYARTVFSEIPDLTMMSLGAINMLTQDNDKGFVLMIEGGAIDWANHELNINRSVLEHTGFSKAIDAVIRWVETESSWTETLVVITADHETGQMFGPGTYNDVNGNGVFDAGDTEHGFQPIENMGRGNAPKVQYASKGHTNALVPFYAKGPGSELFLQRVRGTDPKAAAYWKFSGQYIDNTDIFPVVKAVLAP